MPSLILFLSIIITTFLYFENKSELKRIKKNTQEEFIENKKQVIKEQIEHIYNYVIDEQKNTEEHLKDSLISRVNEAHTIITNIYNQNKKTHTKEEITQIIRAAIKDIRFNNNRGYFFVYDKEATNIIHPLIPKLEGTNLINYKDTKGIYVLRESLALLKDKKESYQEWHWRKIKGDNREFKKIGFVKNIYELDWFLGTGEYLDDFTKDIQKKIISQINKFKFGENGYFIVTDSNNNYISHVNKELIGKNALKKLRTLNDIKAIKKIEKTINEKKGFVYLDFYKPNSDKVSSKIIYLKTIPKWNWVISTGFYKDDVQKLINKKKRELTAKYNENLKNLLIFTVIITLILLLLSLYLSNIIERKFKTYKNSIESYIKENKKQYNLLAQKTKLAAMGEMMENIAHQWRQPLSVITTASSGIKLQKDMDNLSDTFLDESINSINSSANHLSETIEDFRDFFKPDKEKIRFELNTAIKKTIKLLASQLKINQIEIIQKVEDITISSYERELLQVLLNIINNAKDALIDNKNIPKYIFLDIYKKESKVIIKIKDNAGGIPENIINRIFEPYFTTKHKSQGTGIGLYMSQEIISRHIKGTIEVDNTNYEYENTKYTGAIFTITLPLTNS
ncbi:cache domain-containing protein [Arcobacter sp. LA11]|uniref:sensor histidine kinase n=1 Tax=Arcobacter sp. LA11 TaxID=1898176 RepID=UPI0015751B4A|nr:cache domain-containing protein [Arcobacter sp. LA11]